jgi:hypothetical protein
VNRSTRNPPFTDVIVNPQLTIPNPVDYSCKYHAQGIPVCTRLAETVKPIYKPQATRVNAQLIISNNKEAYREELGSLFQYFLLVEHDTVPGTF